MASRATITESGLLLLHKHREALAKIEWLEAAYDQQCESNYRLLERIAELEAKADRADKLEAAFELAKVRGKEVQERKRKLGILY